MSGAGPSSKEKSDSDITIERLVELLNNVDIEVEAEWYKYEHEDTVAVLKCNEPLTGTERDAINDILAGKTIDGFSLTIATYIPSEEETGAPFTYEVIKVNTAGDDDDDDDE